GCVVIHQSHRNDEERSFASSSILFAAMGVPLNVLIVEDVPNDAALLVHELQRGGVAVRWERVETERDFVARLAQPWDLIISDYALPTFNGIKAITLLRQHQVDVPFILVSGATGEEQAVEAMKLGAADY